MYMHMHALVHEHEHVQAQAQVAGVRHAFGEMNDVHVHAHLDLDVLLVFESVVSVGLLEPAQRIDRRMRDALVHREMLLIDAPLDLDVLQAQKMDTMILVFVGIVMVMDAHIFVFAHAPVHAPADALVHAHFLAHAHALGMDISHERGVLMKVDMCLYALVMMAVYVYVDTTYYALLVVVPETRAECELDLEQMVGRHKLHRLTVFLLMFYRQHCHLWMWSWQTKAINEMQADDFCCYCFCLFVLVVDYSS
jgi:hypothetical protein